MNKSLYLYQKKAESADCNTRKRKIIRSKVVANRHRCGLKKVTIFAYRKPVVANKGQYSKDNTIYNRYCFLKL